MEYRNMVISVWNKLISLTSVALDLWITTPAIWTVTHRPVLNGVTFCSWTTWVSYQTWVLATLTDARLISRTIRIWRALRLRWNCFKILQLLILNIYIPYKIPINPYIIKMAGMVEFADVALFNL